MCLAASLDLSDAEKHALDELAYSCYRFNRVNGVTPAGFKLMNYASPDDVDAMERRYQGEAHVN